MGSCLDILLFISIHLLLSCAGCWSAFVFCRWMKHLGTDVPTGISLNRKIFLVLQALDYIVMPIFFRPAYGTDSLCYFYLQLFIVSKYLTSAVLEMEVGNRRELLSSAIWLMVIPLWCSVWAPISPALQCSLMWEEDYRSVLWHC